MSNSMDKSLIKILHNLLDMRTKSVNSPSSSDQHWCTAIEELTKLIPDFQTTNPEFQYELKYVELNQKLLRGEITIEDANHAAEYWGFAS